MNAALFAHTWREQRIKLVLVCLGLAAWGFIMPMIYASFGAEFKQAFESGLMPRQFGGGDVFTLTGAIAVGFIHPIALVLNSVFAAGLAASALAGERERGTLEVLLARPLSRRRVYVTLLLAVLTFIAVAVAAFLAGAAAGAVAFGVVGELDLSRVPELWLTGTLLYAAFATIGLAASATFDRLAPAFGITLAVLLVSYFLEVLGSLWPDAEPLQPYSLFHHVEAKQVLTTGLDASDLALFGVIAVAAVAYALLVFPRRDIAAPS
jgi:ABC-2 type transport system permease protein